jgi:asparagine synthase (glutamine-hydrolysing)
MWAIAVYDENTNRLTLCRDRFGEKPLCYIKTIDGIFYSSEVKILERISGENLVPNKQQLQRLLINGYKSLYKTTDTFFENVMDIPPRSMLHFNQDGTIDSEIYWKPNLEVDESIDFKRAVKLSKEKLLTSLDLRLRADVPVAFSLSGGIDSVALVSLAKRELGVDLQAFTVDIPSDKYNEIQNVMRVVDDLDIKHTFLDLENRDLISDLKTMTKHRKTPVLTLSSYMQWLLMEKISNQGYKVVISGIGADEIFTGYYDHHLYYIAQAKANTRVALIKKWESRVKNYVQNPFLSDPEMFIRSPNFRDYIYLDSQIYKTYILNNFSEDFNEMSLSSDFLRNRMLNEIQYETIPVLLHEEDFNSMYFSIENRSPYLDRNLFEAAYKFPSSLLINDGFSKSILRESVRGIAPDFILDNSRKIGFNAPIEKFIDFNDANTRQQILEDSLIFDIVDKSSIEMFLGKKNLTNSESKFLFVFLSLKVMLDTQ